LTLNCSCAVTMSYIYARQNPLDDARHTLSSWDNCMAKNYCKWPVIVAIIVGSLIVLSVVLCIARCLCCAGECALCCCKCCSCCVPSRGRGHKRMKSEPAPSYPPYSAPNPYAQAHAAAPPAPFDPRLVNQQYRSHAAPAFAPAPAPAPPQYATFERPQKPANEDALPPMPSWHDARDVHVEVAEPVVPQKRGDLEMDRLNYNGSMNSGSMAAVPAARRSPLPSRSPISLSGGAYGSSPVQSYENAPLVGGGMQRGQPQGAYGSPYAQQEDYRRASPAQNMSPVYGAGEAYAQPQPYPQYGQRDQYGQQESYAQPAQRYRTPSPPSTNPYNASPYNDYAADPPRHTHAPAYAPAYAPSDSTRFEPSETSVSAYPGQRSYTPQTAYPGQQNYQAFNPGH
jgi:hypothetical protein